VSDKLLRARRALEVERCRRSAHFLIFDSKYIFTKDEHDTVNPVKNVPDTPYLRATLDCLLVSGRLMAPEDARYALAADLGLEFLTTLYRKGVLFIEKSRDVFATNLVCCYLLWRVRAFPHQLVMVQSKREEDAAPLVFVKEPEFGRLSFMEDHLPKHLRMTMWPRSGAYARLYFENGSQVWGVPEGGDVIRSNHPSVIFSDESCFQPEFANSYTAAIPAVQGGGSYIALSSANPGEFCNLVNAEAA
jgi:uncharacterized protein (DUF2249 family)